jgi:ATP-dependent RNA helicase DeaD
MERFTRLGLSKELTDVIKQMGFTEPSDIQEKAIPLAIAGKDIIGGSATGSGKTLVFASGIIENLNPNNQVQALVLVPTRELAEQVANSIKNFGKNKNLNVLAVYGGVNIDAQIRRLSNTDVVVGTPGRILDHLDKRTLRLDQVKFLVLDEVDRMFDMGFSKDVEMIINECPKKRQTMMFSATISPDIDYLAKKHTKDAVEVAVEAYVDSSKLKQVYYDVADNKKFSLLVGLLKKEKAGLVMVFCNTRRNVDFIAGNLIRIGMPAKAIHGGIEQKKRINVLEGFHKNGGILVCTDVAARGLDIKEVSHVYNYEISSDPKDYIHRIGRTARAGKEGKAITLVASRDYENFRNLMELKETNITPEKLPELDFIAMNRDFRRDNEGDGFHSNTGFRRSPTGRFGRGRNMSKNSRRSRMSRGSKRHVDKKRNNVRDKSRYMK